VTLIDQRILIDAPPQVIWETLTDPAKIAQWHAGYSGVALLTTQRAGPGTRRRCTRAGGGKDLIEEITAWVDGLGYEYRVVEGEPFRDFQGRIRLQTVPDGTIVQWTVSYQPKGIGGRLRDRMSGRQELTAMIAASLRQLRRMVDELGLRMDDDYRARVGIRPRLNFSERAQYQRRHPPTTGDMPPIAPPAPAADAHFQPPAPASEQPVAAETLPPPPDHIAPPVEVALGPEDTAPTRPPALDLPAAEEPDYKRRTPPRGIPAVQFVPPAEQLPPPTPIPVEAAPPTPTPVEIAPPLPQPVELAPPDVVRPPAPAPASSLTDQTATDQPTPPRGTPVPPLPPVRVTPSAPPPEDRRPQTPKTDTGEMSIWDVFGVARPSQQDAAALQDLIDSLYSGGEAAQRRQLRGGAGVRAPQAAVGLRAQQITASRRVRAWGRGQQKAAPRRR